MNKKCMYPSCVNYDKTAKVYCCNACSCDHHDYLKLYGEDKDNKDTTAFEMVVCLEAAKKIVPSNIGVKRVWSKALTDMREAIQFQKENDLNLMVACLRTAEKIVLSDNNAKNAWLKGLTGLRGAIRIQRDSIKIK